jgi:DNA topoisomerase I
LYIRAGNQSYAAQNGSFGLPTLRKHDLKMKGARSIPLQGQVGQGMQRIARRPKAGRSHQTHPGAAWAKPFQYLDDDGKPHQLTSQDVNGYNKEAPGGDFISRQLRTWGPTRMAAFSLVIEARSS